MPKGKKDIQIYINADKDTKEIRVKLEPREIIVELIPFKEEKNGTDGFEKPESSPTGM